MSHKDSIDFFLRKPDNPEKSSGKKEGYNGQVMWFLTNSELEALKKNQNRGLVMWLTWVLNQRLNTCIQTRQSNNEEKAINVPNPSSEYYKFEQVETFYQIIIIIIIVISIEGCHSRVSTC
jgi:hypothetical protein